jgi:hypothetical protein
MPLIDGTERPIGRASVDMSALASTGVQKNPD